MRRTKYTFSSASPFAGLACITAMVIGASMTLGFESGGVGDPCQPEDEFFDDFSGFSLGEVNVESRSFQCETRVCLVNKFQGRVSCPYGTNGSPPDPNATETVKHNLPCEVPGFGGNVKVPVYPQRLARRPDVAVYCSCRCSGSDPNARYCECPSGFECADIGVRQGQGQTNEQQAGNYCIRKGSNLDDPNTLDNDVCSVEAGPNYATCGTPPG